MQGSNQFKLKYCGISYRLKSDIAELKSDVTELNSDFNFRQNLLESKIDNLRWTMVAVGGIIVALIKFLP